jgi:hypothetical protein
VRNVGCSRHPLAFRWRPAGAVLCCGSYHPVSLEIMTVVTIMLIIILVVILR